MTTTTHTRRVYTDKDRAAVFAELTVNDGNVKRTARNLNIPVPTVRRWKQGWERTGVPEEVTTALAPVVGDFLTDALRLRGKLLMKLEELVDSDRVKASEVTTALGVLSDKIRAYENIPTQKVEHTFQLPPPEEIRALFAGAVGGVVAAAKVRSAEIEDVYDAEPAEILELPVGSD